MRRPDFLCIGAMRAGTTTLWDMLGRHPRVWMPTVRKEIHFFDNRDGGWDKGLDWYAAHFDAAPADAVAGEITPNYLFFPEACPRIAETLPDVQLIVMLRDPVKRAWSHYTRSRRKGFERLPIMEALDAEADRLATTDHAPRAQFSYVARGRYVEQLQRFEAAFGRDRMLVFCLEELVRQPEAMMRQVLSHIDADQPGDAAAPVYQLPHRNNQDTHPRFNRLEAASVKAQKWGRAHRWPFGWATKKAAHTIRKFNAQPGQPAIPPDVHARLRDAFGASDAELATWLGRPLPWESAAPTPDRLND